MIDRMRTLAVAVLALASTCCGHSAPRAEGDLSEVRGITIQFEYMGWGSVSERYTLSPGADGRNFDVRFESPAVMAFPYKAADRREYRYEVPAAAVRKLVEQVNAPAWSRDRGVRAIASRIPRSQVNTFEPQASLPPEACSAGELSQLARLKLQREGVYARVDKFYGHRSGLSWTDDYPHVVLQIRKHDGSTVAWHSDSQKGGMLPWHAGMPTNEPGKTENWSLALSDALRALMPPESMVHARLGEERMIEMLKRDLQFAVSEECAAMQARGS